MSDPQAMISDVRELIALTELQDVVFWEISARRNEENPEDTPLQIQAMARRGDEQQLGLRFRATISAQGGDFVADAEAIFSLAEEREIDPELIHEFVERVGIMVVFPIPSFGDHRVSDKAVPTAACANSDQSGSGAIRVRMGPPPWET
jgi:hypothetical protein